MKLSQGSGRTLLLHQAPAGKLIPDQASARGGTFCSKTVHGRRSPPSISPPGHQAAACTAKATAPGAFPGFPCSGGCGGSSAVAYTLLGIQSHCPTMQPRVGPVLYPSLQFRRRSARRRGRVSRRWQERGRVCPGGAGIGRPISWPLQKRGRERERACGCHRHGTLVMYRRMCAVSSYDVWI